MKTGLRQHRHALGRKYVRTSFTLVLLVRARVAEHLLQNQYGPAYTSGLAPMARDLGLVLVSKHVLSPADVVRVVSVAPGVFAARGTAASSRTARQGL